MPSIYFKRQDKPLLVSNKEGERVSADWQLNPKSQDIIQIGGEMFKICDIKRIGNIGTREDRKEFNLDNPEEKAIVRQFENDFIDWCEKNKGYDGVASERWFEELGAIKIKRDMSVNYIIVSDPVLYRELNKKWSGLQNLRIRRTYAKRLEKESIESLV